MKLDWKIVTGILLAIGGIVLIFGMMQVQQTKDLIAFNNGVIAPLTSTMPDAQQVFAPMSLDERAFLLKDEIIPAYEQRIKTLESAHPLTWEVRGLQRQYLDAERRVLQGYQTLMTGCTHHDTAEIKRSAAMMEAAKEFYQRAVRRRAELMRKHQIEEVSE